MAFAQTSAEAAPQGRAVVAQVRDAVKRYPGVTALDHVDFVVEAGEVRALLGKNGAGKSSLIRLLTGAELPDSGTVRLGSRMLDAGAKSRTRQAHEFGVRAVYQELSLVPEMSVAENMFLGNWPQRAGVLDHGAMASQVRDALAVLGLDLDPDRVVSSLSPAQRQLVEIARVLIGQPRLVILDEPTSSLAAAEVEMLFRAVRRLTQSGAAVIYVSHRMNEIRSIADTATVMRDGRVVDTLAVAGASTTEIVRMMLGHEDHRDDAVTTADAGRIVLAVRGLAVPPKLREISFDLAAGEVLGIAGLLGSGRSELLLTIAGVLTPSEGTVAIEGVTVKPGHFHDNLRRGIGLTPEDRKHDGIVPLLGVDENTVMTDFAAVSRGGILSGGRIARATADIVRRLSVKSARLSTPIGTLSGGNQQKVVIGRWVYAGSRILLLDEPTRGVDVEAKRQIYAIIRDLAAEGKSVIFVSSEVEELPHVCDRVLVLRDGRIAEEFKPPSINADRLMSACIAGH
jgi:simple sugar transport system ATP-binding protein